MCRLPKYTTIKPKGGPRFSCLSSNPTRPMHSHTYRLAPHVHFYTMQMMPDNVPGCYNHLLLRRRTKAGTGPARRRSQWAAACNDEAMHMDERRGDLGDWQER